MTRASVQNFIFVSISIYLSSCLSLYLYISQFICVYLFFFSLSVCFCLFPFMFVSVPFTICSSVCTSFAFYLYVCSIIYPFLSVCLSLFIYLSICAFISFSSYVSVSVPLSVYAVSLSMRLGLSMFICLPQCLYLFPSLCLSVSSSSIKVTRTEIRTDGLILPKFVKNCNLFSVFLLYK